MIRTSSSSAAALESSFSSALPLSRLRGASSSKRGKRWFRPRLVALTLLLAAVLGVEEEQSSSSSPLSLASPTLTSSASSAFSTTGAALPPPPRFPDPPYSFAHRGSSGALPEHTMQAYALAVEQVREGEREGREGEGAIFFFFTGGREREKEHLCFFRPTTALETEKGDLSALA